MRDTNSTSCCLHESQDLFAEVHNWKAYWQSFVRPLLRGSVLEAGAGIGANSSALAQSPGVSNWTCLEPSWPLARRAGLACGGLCRVLCGTTEALTAGPGFDLVLYIDVLEHIEDDVAEVYRAARLLRPGGTLIALVPAHGWLYSPFDEALGHYRRYHRASLTALTPPGLDLTWCRYLDSAGLFANAANRMFLRQALPNRRQLLMWDRALIPLSRILDRLLGFRLGKSLLAVWTAGSKAVCPR